MNSGSLSKGSGFKQPVIGLLDEDARVEALHQYLQMSEECEKTFEEITRLAGFLCEAPIAVMVLVDKDCLWFKARVGLQDSVADREHAFCAQTIHDRALFIVTDALADSRFTQNPLVVGDPGVRFYAGAPLINRAGYALGALCVMDLKQRKLSPEQANALEALSGRAMAEMELLSLLSTSIRTKPDRKLPRELVPICAWCKSVRTAEGKWEKTDAKGSVALRLEYTHCLCPKCAQKHFPEIDFSKFS